MASSHYVRTNSLLYVPFTKQTAYTGCARFRETTFEHNPVWLVTGNKDTTHDNYIDISDRNNDYSDTLDLRKEWVGEVGVVTFFVLEVLDYKSAMLIYL